MLEHSAHTKHDAGLQLCLHRVGVDHVAHVRCHRDFVHPHATVFVQADFSHLSHVAVIAFHQGNTECATCSHRLAPTGFFSRQFEHVGKTGLAVEHLHAVCVGILAGIFGQLVNETFIGKHVHAVAHCAPVAHTHTRVMDHQIMLGVGNVVACNRGLGHERIHRVLGQPKGALGDRL